MAEVKTNFTSLRVGIEGASAATPTTWYRLEPNDISGLGAEISTTPRNPISDNRQQQKGKTTDLDSGIEWEGDLTLDHFRIFAPSFTFANFQGPPVREADGTNLSSNDDVGGGDEGFDHGGSLALSTALVTNDLIKTRNFADSDANGKFVVDATNSTTTATGITTTPGINDGTPAISTGAEFVVYGHRFTDLTWTDATTTIGSAGTDLTTLGLVAGMSVYIGGETSGERFTTGTAVGRIVSIATASIVLDKVENHLGSGLSGGGDQAAASVDLLYGPYLTNVGVNDSNFQENRIRFEAALPNLGAASATRYMRPITNLANTMGINVPLTDKATLTFGFVGTDTNNPSATQQATDGITVALRDTDSFSTASEVIRLRIEKQDETALTTDFKSMTLTLNNQVTGEKVIGFLGSKFLNIGNLLVDLEAEVVFTEEDIIAAIRNNDTVTMDLFLVNSDGALRIDIPSMTLGDGQPTFPQNELVKLNLTGQAFQDATLSNSVSFTWFPVLPTS